MINASERFKQNAKAPVKTVQMRMTQVVSEGETPLVYSSADLIKTIKIEASSTWLYSGAKKATVTLVDTIPSLMNYAWVVELGIVDPTTSQIDYITLGTFVTDRVDVSYEKGTTTLALYDYMSKADKAWQDNTHTNYPKTVGALANGIAANIGCDGLEDMTGLPNVDQIVQEDLWALISQEKYRDVINEIANITGTTAIVDSNNYLKFVPFAEPIETLSYGNLKKYKLGLPYGKVNSVVLSRQPQNDDVAQSDDVSIQENGLTEIKIVNNEIADDNRTSYITPLFNELNGISFDGVELNTEGHGWYEIGDSLYIGRIWYDYTVSSTVDGFSKLTDTVEGAPANIKQIQGNASQETLNGNQLIDFNNLVASSAIPSFSNDTLVVSGEGVDTNKYVRADITTLLKNNGGKTMSFECESYDFSNASGSSTSSAMVQIQMTNNGTTTYHGIMRKNGGLSTFTVPSDTSGITSAYFQVFARNGGSITPSSSKIVKPLFHFGTAHLDYEPYCGGMAMPNPQFKSNIKVVSGEQSIKITGKNLFNFAEFAQDKIQTGGCARGTATATDNSITLTATANDCYTRYNFTNEYAPIIRVKPNTDYTLSWKTDTTGSYKGFVYIFGKGANGSAVVIVNAPDIAQRRVFNTGIYDTISFRLGVNTSGNSVTYSDIQLEEGNNNTEFEPYDGQEIKINLGKNLIDINSLATTNITVSNGVATGQGQHFYAAYGQNTNGVPFIKKNGQLSISFKAYTDGNVSTANTNGLVVRVVYTDGTSSLVIYCKNNETTALRHTATTAFGKDVASIQLTYGNDGANIWHVSELQIEANPVPTPFSPYKTPIELAKIGDYQDRIYNDNGTWKIHKAIGMLTLGNIGSLNSLTIFGTPCKFASYSNGGQVPAGRNYNFISDRLHPANEAYSNYGAYANINNIVVLTDSSNDVATFNSKVSGTKWFYPLAAPTDTEITDSELLEQLNTSMHTLGNVTCVVMKPSSGEQGVLEIDYATQYIDGPVPTRKTVITDLSMTLDSGGFKETIKCVTPDLTSTDYTATGGIKKSIYNTEIKTDRQQQEITSIVSRQDTFENQVNEEFTQVYQNIEGLTVSVQTTGGGNYIKNSVGYSKDADNNLINWTFAGSGNYGSQTSPESMQAGAISGSQISLFNGTLTQRIILAPNIKYVLSYIGKKSITGIAGVIIRNDNGQQNLLMPDQHAVYWEKQEITFTPTLGYVDIIITANADVTEFAITDLMLSQGDLSTPWRQADGEILNTQVAVDTEGIRVKSSVYEGDETVMTPLEFAGYSSVSGSKTKVFSLNRDTTEVQKISVQQQISMPPLKVIPLDNPSGWAFVKEGE